MFGYSRIQKMDLLLKDIYYYRAHYCGLCHGLASHFNPFCKFLTGYDATLLALLHTAQCDAYPGRQTLRCPLNLFFTTAIIPPDHPAIRLSSAFTVLMLSFKLEDNIRDGGVSVPAWRVLRLLSASMARRAAATLEQLASFRAADLEKLQATLFRLERESCTEVETLASLTGEGLGMVFGSISCSSELPQNAAVMEALGNHYGRIIYLLDNLRDLQQDRSRGHFNPLLPVLFPEESPHTGANTHSRPQAEALLQLGEFLRQEYLALQQAYDNLTFRQHDRILQNIFFQRLPREMEKALNLPVPQRLWPRRAD